MWGCLKLMFDMPKLIVPHRMALNWTVQSQTKACISKCKQKRVECVTELNCQPSCFVLFPSTLFSRKHDILQAGSVSLEAKR